MKQKFSCQECGSCCKSDEEDMPFSLRLFDFEAKILKKEAKKRGIDPEIVPSLFIPDEKSNSNIVVLYMLDKGDECPFLKNNRCQVYDDRPIMCRSFPIIISGLESGEIITSSGCPAHKKLDKKNIGTIQEVTNSYGDCYLYCCLFEEIMENEKTLVNDLIKKGVIRLKDSEKEFDFVDLKDYLDSKNIRTEDFYQEMKTLEKTKERLKNESSHRISLV